MTWIITDLTSSGYGVYVDLPSDTEETACTVKEIYTGMTYPVGDEWRMVSEPIEGHNGSVQGGTYVANGYVASGYTEIEAAPTYTESGYVAAGYVEGGSPIPASYVAAGYVASGYTEGGAVVCTIGTNNDLAVDAGFVDAGYFEGDEGQSNYVASGYVASGYLPSADTACGIYVEEVEGVWERWIVDPVDSTYVRSGFFAEDINPTPCVPYTEEEDDDMFSSIYGLYPFGDQVPALLINKSLNRLFGSRVPIKERPDIGHSVLGR